MKKTSTVLVAVAAFVSGVAVATGVGRATAQPAPLVAQKLSVTGLTTADLGAPTAAGRPFSKLFVDESGATLSVQIGATGKHYHANANEFQYVVSGTGSEWLGDKRVDLKPGDLLIIPKGTPHGGLTDGVKLLVMKTPPQAPDDYHVAP
jgi:mannose-6-phosphate isomerase-like protein (cupin superfamily)